MAHVRPLDPAIAKAYDEMSEIGKEMFQERAAILEYESGLPRPEAEAKALAQTVDWFRHRAPGF